MLGIEILGEPSLVDGFGLVLAVVGAIDDSSEQIGSVGELMGVVGVDLEVVETVDATEELVDVIGESLDDVDEDVEEVTVNIDDVTEELVDVVVEERLDVVKLLAVVDVMVVVDEKLDVVEDTLELDDVVVEETLDAVEMFDVIDTVEGAMTEDEEEDVVNVEDVESVRVLFESQYGIAACTALTKIWKLINRVSFPELW